MTTEQMKTYFYTYYIKIQILNLVMNKKSFSSIILFIKSLKNLFSIFIIKIFFRSSSKNTIILDNPFFTSAEIKRYLKTSKKRIKNIFFYPYSNLRNFANFFIFNINFHKREK